jgi:hypothetical protein
MIDVRSDRISKRTPAVVRMLADDGGRLLGSEKGGYFWRTLRRIFAAAFSISRSGSLALNGWARNSIQLAYMINGT